MCLNIQWNEIFHKFIGERRKSEALRNSTGSFGTVCQISKYKEELERLIKSQIIHALITTTDQTSEDLTVFALEKQLGGFFSSELKSITFRKKYDLDKDKENFEQQFPS